MLDPVGFSIAIAVIIVTILWIVRCTRRPAPSCPAPRQHCSRQRLRSLLFFGSFALPLATGLIAASLGFKEMWSGSHESFSETLFNYACPFPVAAGCIQIFFWPLSVGVALGVTFIKPRWIYMTTIALLFLGWGIFLAMENSSYVWLYGGANLSLIAAVLLVEHRWPSKVLESEPPEEEVA